jgi:exonuclease VII small subunit
MPIETRLQYLERVVKELEEENKKLNEMIDTNGQGEG